MQYPAAPSIRETPYGALHDVDTHGVSRVLPFRKRLRSLLGWRGGFYAAPPQTRSYLIEGA